MKSIKPLIDAIDALVLRPTLRRLCAAGGANDHGKVGCPSDSWRSGRAGLPRLKTVFVRKYDAGERNTLRAHTDLSHFTFNLALENPWDESDEESEEEEAEEEGEGVKAETGAGAGAEVMKERVESKEQGADDDGVGVSGMTTGGQLFVCDPFPYTYNRLLTIHQSLSRGVAPTLLFDLRYLPRRYGASGLRVTTAAPVARVALLIFKKNQKKINARGE